MFKHVRSWIQAKRQRRRERYAQKYGFPSDRERHEQARIAEAHDPFRGGDYGP
jgi:hypothetical protein